MSNNHPYKIIPDRVIELASYQIFVFGSNTEGRHGAGSALFARYAMQNTVIPKDDKDNPGRKDAIYGVEPRCWGELTPIS